MTRAGIEVARDLAVATLDDLFAGVREGKEPALYGRVEPICELLSADAADRYDARTALLGSALGAGGRSGGDGTARDSGPGGDGTAYGPDAADRTPPEADDGGWPDAVLELGCGAGGVLARLGDRSPRPIGVASDADLARVATRHAAVPVVAGDPVDPPLYGAFDAVVGLDYPTARATGEGDPDRLFGRVYDRLAPGGTAVLDALVEPRATLDDPWRGEVGGYRVDRSVVAGDLRDDRAELAVEYEFARVETGESVEATADLTLRLFDPDEFVARLRDAGFVDVRVDARPDDPGGVLAVARRPERGVTGSR